MTPPPTDSPGTVVTIPPVVIATATPGVGFPDGSWEGVIAADTSFLTVPVDPVATVTTSDYYGTFVITVEDGIATGSYVMTANQTLSAGEDGAEGSAVLVGVVDGASSGPALIAEIFGFDGTATIDGETRPFQFEQPMPGVVEIPDWTFDTVTADYVSGSVSSEGLVAATEAATGVSFSRVTSFFAAVRGEDLDLDALVERLRAEAGIGS